MVTITVSVAIGMALIVAIVMAQGAITCRLSTCRVRIFIVVLYLKWRPFMRCVKVSDVNTVVFDIFDNC